MKTEPVHPYARHTRVAPPSGEREPEELAYKFLSRGFHLKTRIDSHMARIQTLREQATAITSALDGMPHGGGRMPHGLEKVTARIVDMQNMVTEELQDYLDEMERIREAVDGVENPDWRAVLEMRYLSFMTWDRIVEKLPFSRSTVLEYHRRGLREIGEKVRQ